MHSIRIELLIYNLIVSLLTILTYTNGYDRNCPHSSQWKLTSRSYGCSDQKVYLCLVDGLKSNGAITVFSEGCGPEDVSREGFRYKFNPNLDQVPCTASQYQPFTFTTNGNSQCVLRKSLCNARGQILADNGSSITDRSCRCDYRQNYDYVIPPKDPCSCKPAEEDCSCYIRKCDDDKVMIADYRCLKLKKGETFLSEDVKCPIISRSPAKVTTTNNNTFVEKKEYSSTSAITALTSIFMLITVVSILMLWVSLKVKVMPHIMKTNGKSKKDRIIYKTDGTSETYHVIEGDNFTIEFEMNSPFPVKSVRWKKNGCDINQQIDKYILNDSKLSLTVKNLSKDDTGTYECIVSNNTCLDRCVSYLSALHTRMTWVQTLYKFQACRKEDENGITLTVHELPKEYKPEEKTKGDKVTMKPKVDDGKETKSLPEDIKFVVWFYKTADILRVLKPDQHGGINFGDINDGVVKQGSNEDVNDEVVKQGPHEYMNDEVVKQGPHSDIYDGGVKQGQHCDINDGAFKRDQHSDINDGAVKQPDQHCNITDEVTQDKHALVFNTDVSHQGQYVCFIVTANGNIISNGWKLKVVLQGSVYEEVMKHRKDNSYVKTAHEEKAMKSLENHGLVVIVGREGTGKSKISLQLASLFEQKNYLPFKVDQKSLNTTQIADLKSSKVMFIIDHSVYNPNELGQILDQLPEVSNISHTRIIFTCRHLHPLARKFLNRYKLYNDKALIELDKSLTVDDKRKILGVHMEVNNIAQSKHIEILDMCKSNSVELGEDVITEIIKTEPFLGFPLMASKFCSQTENLKKGEKYFTNPPKFLVDEIRDLYQSVLKNKEPELTKEYFILVYLATDERLCFDVSVCSAARFMQINMLIYGRTQEVKPYEMSSIKDAADKLVAKNKYLIKCDDHTYRFIHPCVSKAIFLSSENFLYHFIMYGDVEDIIELVRSFLYTVTDDELVLKLKDEYMYNILCERLTFMIKEKSEKEKKIGRYMYDCFIKLRDTRFLNALLPQLECVSFKGEIQNESHARQVIMKDCMNVRDDTQTVINVNKAPIGDNYDNKNENRSEEAPAIKLYSPPQMIAMIEHLTRTGKDSWIYCETIVNIPDFVVFYGLIVGCKNKFLNDAEQCKTFQIILDIFTQNLKNKSFRMKCCTPMDTFDNKFCHFLNLFNESESCLILERLIEGVISQRKTERNNILKVENIFKERPLQMAAYLGKAKLFTKFWSESKKEKEDREKLYEFVKNGMDVAFVTLDFTKLNFDHDLRMSVCVGGKNAYHEIMEALKKW